MGIASSIGNFSPPMGIRPCVTTSDPISDPSSAPGVLIIFTRTSVNSSNVVYPATVVRSFFPDFVTCPEGDMAQVWIDVTLESLFSDPSASTYGSADRRFRIRKARRSVITNFPVASTVKSVQSLTTTAALPSPKWPRSTRPAAASQSGTESARVIELSPRHTSSAARNRHAPAASLLFTEDNGFLVLLRDIIEKFLRIEILGRGLQQHLFQVIGSRTGDGIPVLRAGMREAAKVVFDFHFLRQLFHLDFRRQLPRGRHHALFRIVKPHCRMPCCGLELRALVLVPEPGIEQQSSLPDFIAQPFFQVRL